MADIGQSLHEARIRARIDISEMEARTKIRAKYLRALENEEWDLLPGSVFVKSFLKTYGDALGLDSRLLVDEFKRRYEGPMDHEARPTAAIGGRERDRASREPRGPLLSPRIAVLLVIVLIVVGLGVYGELSGGSTTAGPTTPVVATKTHTSTTAQTSKTTSTTSTTATTSDKTVSLKLVPTSTVWICVERASGKAVIPGVTYSVGETVPVATGHTLLVNLGNANVTLTVNGKAYSLTSSAAPVGLKITHTGVRSLDPGPTCGQ